MQRRLGNRHLLTLCAAALALAALVLAACSADPVCALGGRGWCENGLAGLAVGTARGEGFSGSVAIVQEGFSVDLRRYGQAVTALQPEGLAAYLAAQPADAPLLVVSDVQVVNAAGQGNVQASGSAVLAFYQGSRKLRSERLSGRLVGGQWQVSQRTVIDSVGG